MSCLAGFQNNYTTPSPALPATAQEQLSCEADEPQHHPPHGGHLVRASVLPACKAGTPQDVPRLLCQGGRTETCRGEGNCAVEAIVKLRKE